MEGRREICRSTARYVDRWPRYRDYIAFLCCLEYSEHLLLPSTPPPTSPLLTPRPPPMAQNKFSRSQGKARRRTALSPPVDEAATGMRDGVSAHTAENSLQAAANSPAELTRDSQDACTNEGQNRRSLLATPHPTQGN